MSTNIYKVDFGIEYKGLGMRHIIRYFRFKPDEDELVDYLLKLLGDELHNPDITEVLIQVKPVSVKIVPED